MLLCGFGAVHKTKQIGNGEAPPVVWDMCNHKNTKSGLELSSNAHVDPFLTRPAADRVRITLMQAALSRRECKQ